MPWIALPLTVMVMLLAAPAVAYERPNAVSLNGEWDFVAVAPLIDIVADRVNRPDFPQLSPTWDEVIDPTAKTPWDSDWRTVNVPQAWEQYTSPGYNGAGWYVRFLDIPPEWCEANHRIWLEFDAVATAAGVWAGGEFVGAHVGDFSRWRVELTDVVQRQLAAPRASAPDPGISTGGADVPSAMDGDGRQDARPAGVHEIDSGAGLRARQNGGQGRPPHSGAAAPDSTVINPYTLLIAVYVDELPGHVTQGFLNMIAPHHGGIWQDVRMYASGPVSVEPDGLQLTVDAETRTVRFEVQVDSAPGVDPLHIDAVFTVGDKAEDYGDGMAEVTNWSTPGLAIDLPAGVLRYAMQCPWGGTWTPDDPRLGEASVTILGPETVWHQGFDADGNTYNHPDPSDEVRQTFAFRDVAIDGTQLKLNGEPLYIRSALNWGYYPGAISPDPGPDAIRREFAYIKGLGFNAETVCLVEMPDYFYDIADEMGVLIWQEYPTWHDDFSARHLPTLKRELTSFILRDRNHPCVVLRSLSVEAGVEDQDVMAELYALAKELTDEPVQDNNSWFSHSNPETTDWYGEDYYLNCNQWARHMLKTLPARLDEYPPKPYIIGETMCFNCWPSVDSFSRFMVAVDDPALAAADPGLYASSEYWRGLGIEPNPEQAPQFGGASPYPYWFAICYDSCLEIEGQLAERYNSGLPDGQDIIFDYLMPQSQAYATASRRFQIQLMHAAPRYCGYTINVVRDIPQLRGGLLDDFGTQRYTPEEWSWHGEGTGSKMRVGRPSLAANEKQEAGRDVRPTDNLTDETLLTSKPPAPDPDAWRLQTAPLLAWNDEWDPIDRSTPVYVVDGGYQDVRALVQDWDKSLAISANEVSIVARQVPMNRRKVLLTSVLTYDVVDYLEAGGAVVLITSKWPGALGSYQHYFWRDSFFAPPLGPFDREDTDLLVKLHPFDLTFDKAEVIPVDDLGITNEVDPLIRLYDTHDLSTVATYDALFATRVGDGLLIASSLDHSTEGGQWVLGKLCVWADTWCKASSVLDPKFIFTFSNPTNEETLAEAITAHSFPQASMTADRLREFATARANQIIPLDEGWEFILDPEQRGEELGYQRPNVQLESAARISCGKSWESQGYNYDGMAWYRRWVDVPADWAGGHVRLVAEGVDDAYTVWVNGRAVGTHGSFTDHEQTVWLQQTVTDITDYVTPGERNFLVLQVVDIVGQGGVYKPLYLAVE